MRRLFYYAMGLACALASFSTVSADRLETGFASPPPSAKARTWWHWINGNVTKEGITADLEAMKRVGIQEAQIFNVDQGFPEGDASFMTPEWLECFRFAVSEAERLGLEIGFHNGAGWSSSGGPWITPEYAMQRVVYSETRLSGGCKIREALPQPPTNLGYYRDIALLAFPTPEGGERVSELDLKSLSGHSFKSHLYPDTTPVGSSSLVSQKEIVDLTSKMSADGTLEWSVPSGEWTLLRVGYTPHGTENRPAGIGGRGLECDKLSREAVDVYWAGGVQPVIDKLGPLVGQPLTNCLIDSYEVGCNNWTAGFDREFRRRRGYDCIKFLPALAGYYVVSADITERFLWDFRQTVGDLIADNYYGYFAELCHSHGMKFSVEPYGGPFDCFRVGDTGDITMGEFWISNTAYLDSPRLAASIAHLNGNSVVGAESFTSYGGWQNHPATLKQMGDWVWSEGVNRFIFHTYTHQPWDVAPGMTFHMYGLEVNRHNTWWEQSRAYMDYLARSQFLLQRGRSAADVLVFTGESSPNDGTLRPEIKAMGYDYDQTGIDKVMTLTVEDGWIRTPAGGRYRMMTMPEISCMTPELAKKISELVKAGAIVTGTKPERSPSLRNYPKCDHKLRRIADEAWGSAPSDGRITEGRVITGMSVGQVLQAVGLSPDFSAGETGADLNFIHRIDGDADIYFVANPRKQARREECRFRVSGKRPQFWDPQTGTIKDAPVWVEEADGTTRVPIRFDPEGSLFIVFREAGGASGHIVKAEAELEAVAAEPVQGLRIISAEYGVFLPEGMADVTEAVRDLLGKGNLTIPASNNLVASDPAAGSLKELRVEFEQDGDRRLLKAVEHGHLTLPGRDPSEIVISRAVYGKFPQGFEGLPRDIEQTDVRHHIERSVASNRLVLAVDDRLAGAEGSGSDPAKKLRLKYTAEGETFDTEVPWGGNIDFSFDAPEPRIDLENGAAEWLTPRAGRLTCLYSSGQTKTSVVNSVPEPVALTGNWDVSFPAGWGAPASAEFDELISWTESRDDGIRHFSGTAAYKKQFTLPEGSVRPDYSLELDLGTVRVIAEVIVNGHNLGVVWKKPFRICLDGYVRDGVNEIEVRVTNLWPNRLIGDDRLPEDFDWGDWTLKSWPDWLLHGEQRPSERITFTTWKHWNAGSPLQLSGLLGPVVIRTYVRVPVN